MISSYTQYITEARGKVIVRDKAGAHMNEPDNIVPAPSTINTQAGGAGPRHWAGSNGISSGQYRGGANPKNIDKKMSKSNVMDFKKFAKDKEKTQKLEEDQLMMGANPPSPERQALDVKKQNLVAQINNITAQLQPLKDQLHVVDAEIIKRNADDAADAVTNAAQV